MHLEKKGTHTHVLTKDTIINSMNLNITYSNKQSIKHHQMCCILIPLIEFVGLLQFYNIMAKLWRESIVTYLFPSSWHVCVTKKSIFNQLQIRIYELWGENSKREHFCVCILVALVKYRHNEVLKRIIKRTGTTINCMVCIVWYIIYVSI